MASANSGAVVGGGASKARGRKSGQKVKKQPQRGMGVAQLEKLRQQEQQQQLHLNSQFLPKQQPPSEFNSLLQGFAHFTRPPPPLHSIHMLQDDPFEERRPRLSPALQPELPSIPNLDHHVFHLNTLSFKKKKIINGVDELDAYLIPGRDTKYYLQQGVQVLAVHPKERNVVMEYGFFPVTPDSSNPTTASTSSPASSSSSPAYPPAAAAAPSIDLSLRL